MKEYHTSTATGRYGQKAPRYQNRGGGEPTSRRALGSLVLAALLVLAVSSIWGCTSVSTVQPWEKQNLAKPEMTFDYDPLDSRYTEHIYSSKEAASGGAGVGGGGCGCN